MTTKDRVPIYLPISYCVLCSNYGVVHEHEQYEDNFDLLNYDNYMDTDQMFQERQNALQTDHYSPATDCNKSLFISMRK